MSDTPQSQQYLRVTKDWGLLIAPREKDSYVANVTGNTILTLLSDSVIDNPVTQEKYALAIGGTIAQMKILPEQYLYARAVFAEGEGGDPEDPEDPDNGSTVVVDEDKINTEELAAIREYMDKLATQVLQLTDRVTDNEVKLVHGNIRYDLLLRKLLYIDMVRHKSVAQLSKQLLMLNSRLFTAEAFVFQMRREFPGLKIRVGLIEDKIANDESSALDRLDAKVDNLTVQITNVTEQLLELEEKVNDSNFNYDEFVEEEIDPIRNDLGKLAKEFAFINNAFVELATSYTDDEINAAFAELLKQSSIEMEGPLTSLKNCILDLRHSFKDTDKYVINPDSVVQGLIDGSIEFPDSGE